MARKTDKTRRSKERATPAPFSSDPGVPDLESRSPLIRLLRSRFTLMSATITAIALVVAALLVALSLLR